MSCLNENPGTQVLYKGCEGLSCITLPVDAGPV